MTTTADVVVVAGLEGWFAAAVLAAAAELGSEEDVAADGAEVGGADAVVDLDSADAELWSVETPPVWACPLVRVVLAGLAQAAQTIVATTRATAPDSRLGVAVRTQGTARRAFGSMGSPQGRVCREGLV